MSIGLYVDEVKDSTWVYFNSDSIVILSEDYKNGKLNGSTKTYYDNGKLYEHKIWNEGIQDGLMKQYYLDGSVKFESNFNSGIKNGIQKSYFQNGKIYSEGSYKNGEKEGFWKFFNIRNLMVRTFYRLWNVRNNRFRSNKIIFQS